MDEGPPNLAPLRARRAAAAVASAAARGRLQAPRPGASGAAAPGSASRQGSLGAARSQWSSPRSTPLWVEELDEGGGAGAAEVPSDEISRLKGKAAALRARERAAAGGAGQEARRRRVERRALREARRVTLAERSLPLVLWSLVVFGALQSEALGEQLRHAAAPLFVLLLAPLGMGGAAALTYALRGREEDAPEEELLRVSEEDSDAESGAETDSDDEGASDGASEDSAGPTLEPDARGDE